MELTAELEQGLVKAGGAARGPLHLGSVQLRNGASWGNLKRYELVAEESPMPVAQTCGGRALSYELRGSGELLVCHPGGPGFSAAYLEDLGGLDRWRTLVLLNPRGTGGSDPARSPGEYALADYVEDVEQLRRHLGAERIDLLGHSHGSLGSVLYAASRPGHVGRLVLAGTAARFDEQQLTAVHEAMLERASEPWFEDARAAMEDETAGRFDDDAELGRLVAREMPFYFARYGDRERAFVARMLEEPVHAAALRQFNVHEFQTLDLRPALADVTAQTLVVAGQEDFITGPAACREVADGIRSARLEVIDGVGHLHWVEAPEAFSASVADFLASGPGGHNGPR